jgi:carboxylesterase
MMALNAFAGDEHRPFSYAGEGGTAVLIHGFPGTPAEMRPLGQALHRAGWHAQGLLLPGFGADIATLPKRRYREWIQAAAQAARRERARTPLVIIGFSMGGAVALHAAAQAQPDALILLNPLTRMDGILWHLLPVIKRVLPQVKPFNLIKVNFDDPETRKGIANFMPGADLDDPAVREEVRNLTIPTGMFAELRQLGESAYRVADAVRTPTLIVQAEHDETVPPAATRKLAARMPQARYVEVDAPHHMLKPEQSAWEHIQRIVLEFLHDGDLHFRSM